MSWLPLSTAQLRGVALSLLLLCLSCPGSLAQSWSLYSFCYTIEQTLSTSPYLPFSIVTQGTLNVSTVLSGSPLIYNLSLSNAAAQGYLVYGATGTRTIVAQGLAAATVSITGGGPSQRLRVER